LLQAESLTEMTPSAYHGATRQQVLPRRRGKGSFFLTRHFCRTLGLRVAAMGLLVPMWAGAQIAETASPAPVRQASAAKGGAKGGSSASGYDHVRIMGVRVNLVTCCGAPELFFDIARFNVVTLSPRAALGLTALTVTAAGSNERKESSGVSTWQEHYAFGAAPVHLEYMLLRSSFVNLLFETRAEPLAILYHAYMRSDVDDEVTKDEWSWAPSLDVGLSAPALILGSPFYVLAFDAGYHLGFPAAHPAMVAQGHGLRVGVTFGFGILQDSD
jgi:hypothetical protein